MSLETEDTLSKDSLLRHDFLLKEEADILEDSPFAVTLSREGSQGPEQQLIYDYLRSNEYKELMSQIVKESNEQMMKLVYEFEDDLDDESLFGEG